VRVATAPGQPTTSCQDALLKGNPVEVLV